MRRRRPSFIGRIRRGGDEETLQYLLERLRVCSRGREMEIQGHLVPEQEAQEL